MPSGTEDQPPAAPEPSDGVETRLYLLTLWCESGDRWRAALRPAGGGPRLGFADLEQLAAHLLRLADTSGHEHERGPPSKRLRALTPKPPDQPLPEQW